MSDAAGDDRSRLLRALALSRRFHLYVVRVESPRAADQLVTGLVKQSAHLRRILRLDRMHYEPRQPRSTMPSS